MRYIDAIDVLDGTRERLTALSRIESILSMSAVPDEVLGKNHFQYMSDALEYEAKQIRKAVEILEAEHKKKLLNKVSS